MTNEQEQRLSQEAGDIPEHIDMEIVETLETPARVVKRWLLEARNGRALESVLLERDRELLESYIAQFATLMCSACIKAVRSLRHKSEPDDSRWNAALYHAETKLESLTIQEQEKQ